MTTIRLGAVGYLNARPLVHGLDRETRFEVRYDIPSECARLLHAQEIDLGLVPSIEFLRGPRPYRLVPGPAVTSFGKVASVAIYTRRDPKDLRSIAMDSSSRTSVALAAILLRRVFGVAPEAVSMPPDLDVMLECADAALIIGDKALFLEPEEAITKIDLGELWTSHTGLPFVYAFWAGRPGALGEDEVRTLKKTRDASLALTREISEFYFPEDAERQDISDRYLRDNIKYYMGPDERAGLERFYHSAAEAGVVPRAAAPLFFDDPS